MRRLGSLRIALNVALIGVSVPALSLFSAEANAANGVSTPVQGVRLAMRRIAPEDERSPAGDEAREPAAPADPPADEAAVPEPPTADAPEGVADRSEIEASAPEASEPESIDRELLQAEPEPAAVPPRRPQYIESDPDAEDAALRRAYAERYRPADNPVKANVVVHGLFTNMGGRDGVGGRMGGARVDVGPTWNHVVVAATLSAWGGKVLLPRETGAEMNGLFGIGPTVGLGRLALVGRGFVDLRVGYDFMYGVVNQRADRAIVVQSQSDPSIVLTQTENVLPHGPRLALDLGLLTEDRRDSRYFHGVGVSMGWQGLVHTFRGNLPTIHMLTMGLVYWFG